MFYRVYHNPAQPKFTIRLEPSQTNPIPKTLPSECLPQRLALASGQEMLNWCFLGYVAFCFSRIYEAPMDAESLIAVISLATPQAASKAQWIDRNRVSSHALR